MTMRHQVIYGQIALRNHTADTETYGYTQILGL